MAIKWGDFWQGLVQDVLTAGAGYVAGKLTGQKTTQSITGELKQAQTSTEKTKNTMLYLVGGGLVVLLVVLLVKK